MLLFVCVDILAVAEIQKLWRANVVSVSALKIASDVLEKKLLIQAALLTSFYE